MPQLKAEQLSMIGLNLFQQLSQLTRIVKLSHDSYPQMPQLKAEQMSMIGLNLFQQLSQLTRIV